MKTYVIITGVALFLIGILGWIFRDSFGNIPPYHLLADIILGLWGIIIGFMPEREKDKGSTTF